MGLKRPIRGRREVPLGPRRQGREPTSPSRTKPPSLGFSPRWEGEGEWHPSLSYIRRGGVPFFFTQFDLRQVSRISLLSLSPSSSGLPLFGVYTWLGFLHHTHADMLLESGSESIFFPPLFWFGARRECRVHRMRVIPRGATLVVLLHR